MDKKKEEEKSDPRLDFMFQYMVVSYKLKPEKWTKMTDNEDNKVMFAKFFDDPSVDCLNIAVSPAGALIPNLHFPTNPKGKSTYFIRRSNEPITTENVYYMLIFGDMSPDPLEEVSTLIEQAWLPFLANPNNHEAWPSVISEDVIKHTQDMTSLLYISRGKCRGEIFLPMPIGVERVYEAEMEIIKSRGDIVDMYLKNSIEGVIIKWVIQIHDILIEDPDHIYDDEHKPTPAIEVEFWKNRLKNLESVYDQLCDPRVKKMASILELTDSAYYESFKKIFKTLVAALAEARDVNLFMKPLNKWFQAIESADFDDSSPYIEPLFVTIGLVWANSQYYCKSSRIINLSKQIVNLFMSNAKKYLDPSSLFQGEFSESLKQVRTVINTFALLKEKYFEYYGKIPEFFKPGVEVKKWDFEADVIFDEQKAFMDRISCLEYMFVFGDDYSKLEKVEIGGLPGKTLSAKVVELSNEFGEAFTVFQTIAYDPLDTADDSFVKDFADFKEKSDDLDSKLTSIFINAFDECNNLISIMKFICIISPFLERSIVRDAIMSKLYVIFDLYEKEVDMVKIIFDENILHYIQREYMLLDHYHPPTAGTILWTQKLERRLTDVSDAFDNLEFDFPLTPHAYHVLDKKNEMLDLLKSLDNHVLSKWSAEIPVIIKRNLRMPLLIREEETMFLSLNFSPQFQAALREVRYLKLAGITGLPPEAEQLFQREDVIRNWIDQLHRIIYWYNQIRSKSHPTEFDMISEEFENIDDLIDILIAYKKWKHYDTHPQIEVIYNLLSNLHNRIEKAQKNVERITAMMLPWGRAPLYERKEGKPDTLIGLDDRKERVEKRYNNVTEVGVIIHKLMKQNYNLFLKTDEPEEEVEEGEEKKKKAFDEEDQQVGEDAAAAETDKSAADEEIKSEEEEIEEEQEEEEEKGEEGKKDKETGEVEHIEKAVTESKEDIEIARSLSVIQEEEDEEEDEEIEERVEGEEEEKLEGYEELDEEEEEETKRKKKRKSEEQKVEEEKAKEKAEEEKIKEEKAKEEKVKEEKVKEEEEKVEKEKDEVDPLAEAEGKLLAMQNELGEKGEEEEEGEEEEDEGLKTPSLTESEKQREAERIAIFNEKWKMYEEYVDELVSQGLQSAVSCSFQFFIEEMDQEKCVAPIFEVSFELQEPDIVFIPCFDLNENGFRALVESLLNDILYMAKLIPRVHKTPDVLAWLEKQAELERLRLEEEEEEEEEEDEEGGTERKSREGKRKGKGKDKERMGKGKESINKGKRSTIKGKRSINKRKKSPSKRKINKVKEIIKREQYKGKKGIDKELGVEDNGKTQDDHKETQQVPSTDETPGTILQPPFPSEDLEDDEEMDFAAYLEAMGDAPPPDDYMDDVESNVVLCNVATEILCRVQIAISEAIEFTQKFQEHSYLWMGDREVFLEQFLKYGHALSPEEEELEGVVGDDGTMILRENKPTLSMFKDQIDFYESLYDTLQSIETEIVICKWLRVDIRPFKHGLLNTVCKWSNSLKQYLINDVEYKLTELDEFTENAKNVLTVDVDTMTYDQLIDIIRCLFQIKERSVATDNMFEPIKNTMDMLKQYGVEFSPQIYQLLQDLPYKWLQTKKYSMTAKQNVAPLMAAQMANIRRRVALFDLRQQQYREKFRKLPVFSYPCDSPYEYVDQVNISLDEMEKVLAGLQEQSFLFDIQLPDFRAIKICRKEAFMLKTLWDYANVINSSIDEWKQTLWQKIDIEGMEAECKKFGKDLRGLDKEMRTWDTYVSLEDLLKNLLTSLGAVNELQNPAIRERHWQQLMQATKVRIKMDEKTTLKDLLDLNLHLFEDDVKNIVDKSVKELAMEKILKELNNTWRDMKFKYEIHPRTGCSILLFDEELVETLEENQAQLQNMMSSKYIGYFLGEVSSWQNKLSTADMIVQAWFEVQRTWSHLESVFIGSEDIRRQLPKESKLFERINKDFIDILNDMAKTPNVVQGTSKPHLYNKLEQIQEDLVTCEKALTDYLETKRLTFPRFYFVSPTDLLDILSNGNQPELVAKHLSKLFDSIASLHFQKGGDGKNTKIATKMVAKDEEVVPFYQSVDCNGKVEVWLNRLTDEMIETMRHSFGVAVVKYDEKPREEWLFDYPAQAALVGTQIWWTTEVDMAFSSLEEGYESAMKDYQKKQISQLNTLIGILCGELTSGDRQKIMTICTIDVHSRDVVAKLIAVKVENAFCFQWQTQLRHRWDKASYHCFCNICDAQFRYSYEYLGCTPRLVITPLTDRCYITLTQSLHLVMGGAPAGPAGTGKTETTKDLGRAIGIMVYVFNCSEQMDYKSCGNIYKGLAQTGAWGCFDEFNRISVEVLSVVAVQVKAILDAIKAKKTIFNFVGEIISLNSSVGMFITMNPGYAGRTELPENLKAQFRPCAMVVPDFALICEIMLVAEGFQGARLLARKFITLYTLCKELLSKQAHYDWGLRAIKSVLVVAGSLKRGDRDRPEDQVLMRALRDFNIPKIVTDDVPVFMGLIGDLFPALDVPRSRDLEFESLVKKAIIELQLQAEDNFVLKVVQLQELLAVRHSVFIIGYAGTGKTMVWRSLFKTYQLMKLKPFYNDLNPKAVTNDELFGIINPSTREWKDGLFSVIMRDQAYMTGAGPKWILLDGDIDPMWIESMNTIMDDNKILTLASNERIPLTPKMRLIFEIFNLDTATPATVSRAGILYINPQDLGWNPYITSWVQKRDNPTEKAIISLLFEKYIPGCVDVVKTRMKKITPLAEVAHLEMLCNLLECFLIPRNVPPECPKDWYEIYFVFACIWAFGSTMFQDQVVDYRVEFSKWWTNEFKTVKIPAQGTVFDYVVEEETKKFVPWTSLVRTYELSYEIPLQSALVDTAETSRLRYFMDLLIEKKIPVMLVGSAGSGKSVIIADKLTNLSEKYLIANVPFNFYTTSEMLQKVLEKPLEKKSGRNFGPPGSKTLIYFVDDMNMPEVDRYGTVQPHTLIRQYMDYGHWYDRTKLSLKEIHNCMFISSMNPTSGSFTINPRLQRHFSVFAVSFPTGEPLSHIYFSILSQHLSNPVNRINAAVTRSAQQVVNAAIDLHKKITATFLPTAVKFHYTFNLRDLSNIFQVLLFSIPECIPTVPTLMRLWIHEAQRVYRDKLVDPEDVEMFDRLQQDVIRDFGGECKPEEIFKTPLIFCHFAEGIGEAKYLPVHSWPQLTKLLTEAQSQYNDLVGALNLVLFEDAMEHVCRINRIAECPRGNALLIGVGGSGKQSLSRLAAFISSLQVFQVQLRQDYGIGDLRADLNGLYMKAGMKNTGIMFLMADSQVGEEKFLVVINDLLASGEIPELFADDEIENIINNIRNEVKSAGISDTRENCWKFFIQRVRQLMKVVLCFSPVGATLRVRARKFPALVNCTSLDWFHPWPQNALESVSRRFVEEIPTLPEHLRYPVSLFMAYVHMSVDEMSGLYLQNEHRYNYTTPKTFLEQINLFRKLLNIKTSELQGRIIRLENGLDKLASAGTQVAGLKVKLADQEVVVAEKNAAADKLIQVVGKETEKVSKEKEFVAEEEAKVRTIQEDVSVKQRVCESDLKKAEPALLAAREALNTLNKNNLTELKSFGSPPAAVVNVTAAVLVLFSQKGKIPKDRSWKECKILMAKVDAFLDGLINYNKESIPADVVKETKKYIADSEFDPDKIISKSQAAAGLCAWVINIIRFYEVYEVVEPKRKALQAANEELSAAQAKLVVLNSRIAELEGKLAILTADFESAVAAKVKCQQEADATALTIDLANRLVNGLASEKVRWKASVEDLKKCGITLPGDVLLVTAFISYVGCFTRLYRVDLMEKKWKPYFATLKNPIPRTEGLEPLSMLTDDAQIAKWNNEGLPADSMSAENATILVNSDRWPLMIDPQLQGIKWIKQKYGKDLKVVRLGVRNYIDTIEAAIMNGNTVLIENIGESVDAVLDPILGRNLVKKGKAIKMGDKEIDYNPNFRLILQTKLANPHYKPEMQALTTLINFTVTVDGLEEQLLGEVVKAERPDLEKLKSNLTKQQNIFKITLAELEDDLLARLAAAGEDILSDKDLVLNLEITKKTSAEIEVKVAESKKTSVELDQAREEYRAAAARGSLLYFILNELSKINPIYQFSLKAFNVVFKRALSVADPAEKLPDRVVNLQDSITFCVFMYTNRGLFERDKLIFMSQLTIRIFVNLKDIPAKELDYLLRFPIVPDCRSPVDFLSDICWGGIKTLSSLDDFQNLDRDIEGSAKTWKKFVDSECPENEKFPQEWKNKSSFQKLCMMRALRADRMTYAMRGYIEEKMGSKYTEARTPEFAKSYKETSSATPVFFILSPGVDPLKDVEKLGKKLGFTFDKRNFHNVSLGQGQEVVAEDSMDKASKNGHWVILQNIHLVAKWLPILEKKMEHCSLKAHKKYRLYLSAEPAADPSANVIPQGILESSIKITNEPPTGMLANIHKALDNFNQDTLEMCSKETEFKAILFSLCYFHAVVAERRKFGPQGWNRVYPFNVGDLTISVHVLYNYLENASSVPWEDLRYLFGEIMYGGHITDDWDRRLCRTYLSEYMNPPLLEGELQLAPGFPAPPSIDYKGYHMYIDGKLPPETPYLYGLHPNAEIGFLTTTSEKLFRTLFELQPRESGSGVSGGESKEEKMRSILDEYLDRVPEFFNMTEIMSRTDERTPYIIVALQECERMNFLVGEISSTLHGLNLGLKGELTITSEMEALQESLFFDEVPNSWAAKAYPSMYSLGLWFSDLQARYRELETWTNDFSLPSSVWLGGLFNPQSFLTAIMQSTARKNEWPLDKMCLNCDVTKKFKEEVTAAPREGSFINGLFMEGARWDIKIGSIADSKLKELYSLVPVIFIKAITQDKQDTRNVYQCPVYKTKMRGPTFVWTFNLKTKERESKWTLAGVAILLQV